MLRGKHILLGITGSIAAYKSVLLVRELVKLGAEVQVICTPSALDFVTPVTLSTLSKRPVFSEFVTDTNLGTWTNHVELGKWADAMLVAPMSANTLSKISSGACDNLLMATYLSADCPVFVAPAMDLDMYAHWTTKQNLKTLESNGVHVIDSTEGELASGLVGKGRMAEPEVMLEILENWFDLKSQLKGKRIIVSAGPTHERIDPVRYIGNDSSGKMGFAIAEEAFKRGADVILVSGPSVLHLEEEGIERIDVESAQEMHDEIVLRYATSDAVIMAAAVADYTPKTKFNSKLKKADASLNSIELMDTVDILKALGKSKKDQKLVGFALETDNELENAQKKLKNKNLDMLVMNSLKDAGAGFKTDTNKVTFVYSDTTVSHELKSKKEVAKDILDALEAII